MLYTSPYATGLAAALFLAGLLDQATDFTTTTLTAAASAFAAAALLRPARTAAPPRLA